MRANEVIERHAALETLINVISQIPAVEAPEVKHGKWIYIEKTKYRNPQLRCSICYAEYSEHWLLFIGNQPTGAHMPPKYCPDCGARMDGGAENG